MEVFSVTRERQRNLAMNFAAFLAFSACCIGIFSSVVRADQGIVIHLVTNRSAGLGGEPVQGQQTVYITESALKESSSEGFDSIILFDGHKVIAINHHRQTYEEYTSDEVQAGLERAAQDLNSEEQKKMLRGMLGEPGKLSLTEVGSGGVIAGYQTLKYDIEVPPLMKMEIWSAPDLQMPPRYFEAMQLRPAANPLFDMSEILDAMKEIKGVHLKTVMTMSAMGMQVTTTSEATSVETADIPASVFQVPANYRNASDPHHGHDH
jgi:hypothetical protein